MSRKELLAEHALCDREQSGCTRLAYKVLHLRRRGCPACQKLRRSRK